jgi:hypothetical protein
MKPELDKKGITVENNLSKELPELKVDGKKFRRLFELLLKEEISALARDGRIRFIAQVTGP